MNINLNQSCLGNRSMNYVKILLVCLFISNAGYSQSGFSVKYNPSAQQRTDLQYFKPSGDLFVGDCIPFFHDGTYFLYWLLD